MSDMSRGAPRAKQSLITLGIFSSLALVTGIGIGSMLRLDSANAAPPASGKVAASLKERLPRTQVSQVDCGKHGALCEVTAGDKLFYVDSSARYLVIGRVYDMETRQDLTAARLLELNPDMLVASAARAGEGSREPPLREVRRPVVTSVPLAELPKAGAVEWGPAGGERLVVFSDLRCPYCRRLSEELRRLGVRVEERLISVLGTRELSDAVYCAKDPAKALHAAYAGKVPTGSPQCDTRGLDANEAFARRHGFMGTPVVVRADGAVIEGYRPAPVLAAWLKGKKA